MSDKFMILYQMNHQKYNSEWLTEDELGHKIAYLMRYGACDVQVVITDSSAIE